MSAQGGTIRAPLHVPIRPVVAIVAAAAAIAITFGVIEANREPARGTATVTRFDWSPTTGHPAVRDRFDGHEQLFDSIVTRDG
jgi:hypothetical protein